MSLKNTAQETLNILKAGKYISDRAKFITIEHHHIRASNGETKHHKSIALSNISDSPPQQLSRRKRRLMDERNFG